MELNSKRDLDRSPSSREGTPSKRCRNIFAMQQEKDRNARRTRAPKSHLSSPSPTQEELNDVSFGYSYSALPKPSKLARNRFRKRQFMKHVSRPSPLAGKQPVALDQSFEKLSFKKRSEDEEVAEDSEDEAWKEESKINGITKTPSPTCSMKSSKSPALTASPTLPPISNQGLKPPAPKSIGLGITYGTLGSEKRSDGHSPYGNSKPAPVSRAASDSTQAGIANVPNPFKDLKPAPATHPRPSRQAISTGPATLIKQSFVNKKLSPALPTPAIPTKQREGFGLSYTDTRIYGSDKQDDIPDTDGESDNDTVVAPTPQGSFIKSQLPVNATFSFMSFASNEGLVVREVGSFHHARPQRRFPCTSASREATIVIKAAAQKLCKYDESMEIYGSLVLRLERMVKTGQSLAKKSGKMKPPTAFDCAYRLREFLDRYAKGRIETGECEAVVQHESEWAGWMVEATRSGVMHVKGLECSCRADWKE